MPRFSMPDIDTTLATIERVASAPTAPYHEFRALRAIRGELERNGVAVHEDAYGQVSARVTRGPAKRSLALIAHTDHPAFEVTEAYGREGRARILGGLYPEFFAAPVPVLVCDDGDGTPFAATLDGYVSAPDSVHNSPGHCRIRADRELRAGQFAVMDLVPFVVHGDELHLRAADDLALCAVVVLVLAALRDDARPHDVHAVFTRGEESGLYGARLVAEDGLLPRDVVVVSLEASRALAHAAPGRGVVVRAGDVYNTFDNDAERFLRVAREELTSAGVATQRALLTGGTCESSAFVRLGWSATGIAVPNVNYHNQGEHSHTFTSEVVRLSDLRSAVALLVEAAAAAGVDAEESWWPDVKVVPRQIRELLRIRR
ncbi:MAG: M20/M25/M40 family metallo-hydrolase [Chloroflexi bacterium]|nr:MAG: M20/M25/M40 family metallo-hydrolase [Chloroflexota bacterium]